MIHTSHHEIQLILNDTELDNNDLVLESLTVYEAVQLSLPSIVIQGTMPEVKYNWLVTNDKVVGRLRINRLIDNDSVSLVDIPVRVFAIKGSSDLQNANVQITLNYDWDFAYNSNTYYKHGTSSDVFKELSLQQGFKTTLIHSSSDGMTWINPNQRGLIFLNDVASAAWNSDSSCYLWGVRADNSLIFRDLARRNNKYLEKYIYLNNSDDNDNVAVGYSIESNITMLNSSYGYGRNSDRYNYEGKSLTTSFGTVNLIPEGQKACISKGVPQGSFRSTANFGNTHINYQKAILQNLRIKSTYNNKLSFTLINDTTDIGLLDNVTVVNNSEIFSLVENLHGIVSQKTSVITSEGMRYQIVVDTNAFNTRNL